MLPVLHLLFHVTIPLFSVVLVGFDAPSYTVNEGANQVRVCVRLEGMAELVQPIQMRVTSSKDGTATGNYVAMLQKCSSVVCF